MVIPFRPVKRVKIFQDVVNQIKTAVLSGRLKPGQELPSERELERMFQTSRPTIREAVRVMENAGLISVRSGPKGGIFIRRSGFNPLHENFIMLTSTHQASLAQIAEFREHLESQGVDTALEALDDSDIKEMQSIVGKAEKCLTRKRKSIRMFLEYDARFHLKLTGLSGNPLYVYMLDAVTGLSCYYERFYNVKPVILEESLQDLCDILAAVTHQQPYETRGLLKDHIRKFNLVST